MASNCQNCDILAKYSYWNELPPRKHNFFKIMPDDFDRQLMIPKRFTECFKGKLCTWSTLFGPSGNEWRVKLLRSEDDPIRVVFLDGWPSFVRNNGVQFRDFLVFRYTDISSFEVFIFDASGCEREESYFNKNGSMSRTSCTSTFHREGIHDISCSDDDQTRVSENSTEEIRMRSQGKKTRLSDDDYDEHESLFEDRKDESEDDDSFDSDSEEKANRSPVKHPGRLISGSASRRSSQGKLSQMYYESNRRPLEEGEKYRGSILAEKHHSMTKSLHIVLISMKPTYVYNGFNMTIPKNWAIEYMLPEPHEVELRVPKEGKKFIVGCRWTRSKQCQLRKNWPCFVLENNLEEHDVCGFEWIKTDKAGRKITMNVHIYRAVDQVVPLSVKRRMVSKTIRR